MTVSSGGMPVHQEQCMGVSFLLSINVKIPVEESSSVNLNSVLLITAIGIGNWATYISADIQRISMSRIKDVIGAFFSPVAISR